MTNFSVMSGNRISLVGALYGLGAIVLYNQASQLNMLWLGLTTIPIAGYYSIQWPHERVQIDVNHAWLFHMFGALAIMTWVFFVFGAELATKIFPAWIKDQVHSELLDTSRTSRVPVSWEADGRQAKAENSSVWFAAVLDRKIRASQIEQTILKSFSPVADKVQKYGFSLTVLLTVVCGAGVFISSLLAVKRSQSSGASTSP
jgi:hypothetical protein